MGYIAKLATGEKSPIQIDSSPLGKGGEGSVYVVKNVSLPRLPDASKLVAKIYHEKDDKEREAKITAMLQSPPDSDSVAWPLASLYEDSAFIGYLMVKLSDDTFRSWAELSNAKERKDNAPDFAVNYAITASKNLAIAIQSIHNAGHCVGDVNESNILVASDARVMIIDTDSAQIKDPSGKVYKCLVGKPEYTAPEISHGSLKDHTRTFETDIFAYSVAVFQMLTGGSHPTDSVYSGSDDPPSTIHKIREGIYPGLVDTPPQFKPVPRIPVSAIPLVFKNIFKKTLSVNPEDRSNFASIIKAEDGVTSHLVQCSKVKSHWYDEREKTCGWCAHADKVSSPDPWNPAPPKLKSANQTSLPSVNFKKSDDTPVIRRAGVNGQPSSKRAAQRQPSYSQPQTYGPPIPQTSSPSANVNPVGGPGFPPGFNQPSGSSAGQSQTSQPQQPSQQQAAPPNKIKGKTALPYKDGSWRPRPPLSQLFRAGEFKLAFQCIGNETPKYAKFWWSKDRKAANLPAAFIGFIIGSVISLAWIISGPKVVTYFAMNEVLASLILVLGMVATITASIAVVILLISSITDFVGERKRLPPGRSPVYENFALMILQFIVVSIVFGPFFAIGVTIWILFMILKIIFAIVRA